MPATLSQIQAWSTEHLIEAAIYWTKTADQWEGVFLRMRNQSYGIAWNGAGGDALRERTSADLPIVSAKADQLREAAAMARNGASDISAAQRRVLYAVEDAQTAGFTIEEDLSVTDTLAGTTAAEQAARQAQAQAFAGDIRVRAEQLDGAEIKVAGKLSATTAGLSNVSFAQNPISNPAQAPATHRNGVQLVDFTQNSDDPPPFAPWDTSDGTPPPPQPAFLPPYEQALTAPPAPPTPGPPMPASPPPAAPLTATGPGSPAAAKPGCSIYDATKALLEPPVGMIGILTAVPEGATGVGIPAALGQIAVGTVAVADGLDAAGKCLD